MPGRLCRLSLDGLAGATLRHEPLAAWGPIDGDGRLVVALDVSVRLDTGQPLRSVEIWFEPQWDGEPGRAPDMTVDGLEIGWSETAVTKRLPPLPYPFVAVVRNSGPPIVEGAVEIRELVAEVY